MSKGLHATKTGEIVFVTPLGGNHYRLDYSDATAASLSSDPPEPPAPPQKSLDSLVRGSTS